MKTSRVFLLALVIFFTNLIVTLGIAYYAYQNFILPGAIKDLSDTFIEANESITSKMPIGAKEKKQYIPEMNLSFPYEKASDQLLYIYMGDDDTSTQVATINYEASSINSVLRNAQTFDELFQAFEGTGDCRRLYAVANKKSDLGNYGLETSKYEKLKSVELNDDKKLYIFKLKKSCESKDGIGSDTHKHIQSILSSAKSY